MSTKPIFTPPNLANATISFLVDELGSIRERKNILQKEEGFIKQALMGRLDSDQYLAEGETFACMIENASQNRFDSAATKEEFGLDWWAKRCKNIEFTKISTSRKT